MAQQTIKESDAPARKVEVINADDELKDSYITYAMSVIAGRSLPDVRDGLKPVQRRILYSMHDAGVTSNSSHRKSSSVVGETMGDYHPHGDKSIYDALARMAQPFSLRYTLVDGQGNFGSIDDDPPAAMRYTEARLSSAGEELLKDISKHTVDYQANYDDRIEEPEVLPAGFPNLLVNGSSGIAVGLSTNIPPHNLGEVIDATIHLIDNDEVETKELMEHLPGPDFPTGGKIAGRDGIYDAYKTGRGQITIQADYHIEEVKNREQIVITEIPYQQDKSRLIEKVAEMVKEEELNGVKTIRDESDRDGIRIVIELKTGTVTDVVENKLLNSVLQKRFSIQLLALVDDEPKELTLKQCLNYYIEHRKDVVRRRSEKELEEKEDRKHILEGRLLALQNVDDIVELIRQSDTRSEAIENIQESYDFSEPQAEHIVRMQLGSLTSMEEQEIREEYSEVESRIERLNDILNNESILLEVIKEELEEVKEEHDDDRRTQIVDAQSNVSREDLIPEQDIMITLTNESYIKRLKISEFSTQNRGGKGIISTDTENGTDPVTHTVQGSTHDLYYVLTDQGNIYELKGYEVPEYGRNARGTPAINILELDGEENVTSIINVGEVEDKDNQLLLVTKNGKAKRTGLEEFENIFQTGITGITLEGNDEVIQGTIVSGDEEVVAGTTNGRAVRFDIGEITKSGRTAKGVNIVKLTEDNTVTGVAITSQPEQTSILTITENGYGKRTELSNYSKQSRYGKGLKDIQTTERNGNTRAIVPVVEDDTEIFITSEGGKTIRTRTSEIHPVNRNTKGVTIMRLNKDDSVSDVSIITETETEETDEEVEEE